MKAGNGGNQGSVWRLGILVVVAFGFVTALVAPGCGESSEGATATTEDGGTADGDASDGGGADTGDDASLDAANPPRDASDVDVSDLTLDELVDAYENEVVSRDTFVDAIEALEDMGAPSELSGTIESSTLLKPREQPYHIVSDLDVDEDAILVVEAGAELILDAGVDVTVAGRFYAVGTQSAPIRIRAEAPDHYGSLELEHGPNQLVWVEIERGTDSLVIAHSDPLRTLVEKARFDAWGFLAIEHRAGAGGLHVLDSQFGYETSAAEGNVEIIHADGVGSIIVEQSRFSPRQAYNDAIDFVNCDPDALRLVIHNRFDGGEDDAIDLDQCSAFVIGNHIANYRPADLTVRVDGVNGGGVTGEGEASRPFIANNVIENCYHGIGFKNGARPVIVNNTIIQNNIGVTLYQTEVGQVAPEGILINNVLWDNVSWTDDTPQEIVLHGKWWPEYNQVDDVQASIDARYNVTASLAAPYVGEGNLNDDPMIEVVEGLPMLASDSPAVDSGLEDLTFLDVNTERLLEYLSRDHLGRSRQLDGEVFVGIDRGALESE